MANLALNSAAWVALAKRIKQRDGYVCVYCGADANTVDHIVPRSKGGTDDEHNLVTACNRCNGAKGARDPFFYDPRRTPCAPRNLSPQGQNMVKTVSSRAFRRVFGGGSNG